MKTPNTKHQTPGSFQIPNAKSKTGGCWTLSLRIGVSDFVGVWCLVFGVFR
jgi:hypothetical protein